MNTPGDNQPPNPTPLMGAATSTPAATPEPRVIVVKFDEPEKPAHPVVVSSYRQNTAMIPFAVGLMLLCVVVWALYRWVCELDKRISMTR